MASIASAVVFSTRISPCDAFGLALTRTGVMASDQSAVWLGRLLEKLGRFLEHGRSVQDIRSTRTDDVAAWVDAYLPNGRPPSLATRHNRRSAAAMGFRVLRDLGVVDHDPTLDIVLPDRPATRQTRPLTQSEVEAGRAASLLTTSETRLPSVWALAEATATTHEIPRVHAHHVDPQKGTVELCGSAKTEPRVAVLTEWGAQKLGRRIGVGGSGSGSMTYSGQGSPQSMQASSSMALSKILTIARLRSDPAMRPESVRAWAGRRIFQETGRIEAAAVALGCSSLDTTARIIGFDWADLT